LTGQSKRRGRNIPVSVARRMVTGYMWAASRVPVVDMMRSITIADLAAAHRKLADRPAWAAVFGKAFALVATEMPELRRAYLKWPWPHFHEYPDNTLTILIEGQILGDTTVLPIRIRSPETMPVGAISTILRDAVADPMKAKFIRRMVAIARCPAFIRYPIWWLCLNIPRVRRYSVGTIGISSIASLNARLGTMRSPGVFFVNYGPMDSDGRVELRLSFDHRTIDGAQAARVLGRLEEVLNSTLLAELS
jgi:hypothetical protein